MKARESDPSSVCPHLEGEVISPLHVGDMRVLEFAGSETLGIFRVAKVVRTPLGLGYGFQSVRDGNPVFVYDKDITRSGGVLIVMDGR